MDQIGEAWIRVKGIEPGSPGEPEQVAIPEPISRFQPVERRVNIAKSRVNYREGDRWSMTLRTELLEFSKKAPGFVCPAEPAINIPQVGE
jgi:hypothetical protein